MEEKTLLHNEVFEEETTTTSLIEPTPPPSPLHSESELQESSDEEEEEEEPVKAFCLPCCVKSKRAGQRKPSSEFFEIIENVEPYLHEDSQRHRIKGNCPKCHSKIDTLVKKKV